MPGAASQPARRLAALELAARKGLGQHFLTDRGALSKIVAAADITPADTVVEVGPGLGILTEKLLERAGRVIAVELDRGLAKALEEEFSHRPNLTVITEDILALPPGSLLAAVGAAGPYKVVANLPYYITSAVLRHFLESARRPSLMVVMVQREVARSIVAAPGDLSLLGLSVQLFGEPRIVGRVPAGSFYPPPKVESAIVKILPYAEPAVPQAELPGFFVLARAAFCAARKQVQNSLVQGLSMEKSEIISRLAAAGVQPSRRAETLSIAEWMRLWREFKSLICRT